VVELGKYIECICILHNILIENDVPLFAELYLPRERDFGTMATSKDFLAQYSRSHKLRDGIAKYLHTLPNCDLNEYPFTV
jgi:hypothetical protein